MAKQSVRIQLKDGGEVEVASVAVAQKAHPDAKIVQVTTWGKDGVATTEPYSARAARAEKPKAEPKVEPAVTEATS
jgi:hypothetical protein